MKKPTKMGGSGLAESWSIPVGENTSVSKTHFNGNIQRFVSEALKYLRPEQIEELIKILMEFSSSARHLEDGIITAEELIHVFTKDTSQGGFTSCSASETHEQSSFHFTPLSEGNGRTVIAAAKDRIALDLQKKLTRLFSEKLGIQVQRIVEHEPRGTYREIPLPAAGKDEISESTYGKQTRAAEMSDKVKDAIKKGVHPGKFVFDELIYPSRETLEHIAEKIDVHWVTLSSLKNGRRNLSPQLASKLSRYFQKYSTVELLMIQAGHDAMKADQQVIGLHEEKDPTPA